MSPCTANDIIIIPPSGPSGPAIPPFGVPFSIPPSSTIPFPAGFPEDLISIFNNLQMLIPPGTLKPSLSPNFSKDIFDALLSMFDQFMPFLMLYKFFLPALNLIICIIEVLCALLNPFALISALDKLFTQCIPEFLNLFPQFAMITMIISVLLLLLQLVEYIIAQLVSFIAGLLRNINALVIAFQTANDTSVANIANKLSSLLCVFQNIFVLLAAFGVIIAIFQDILKLLFSIPPCEGNSNSGCCGPQYCPTIVQNPYTRTTGTLQYLPESGFSTPFTGLHIDIRSESIQLYDAGQTVPQAFWNIVDGYDIPATVIPKPVFFPTDASYSATTSPQQAAYTVNLRLFYNPVSWGRLGAPQYIRFLNCIVLAAPTQSLENYNNTDIPEPTGVFYLAGGLGYLDDGVTPIDGYDSDGVTPISQQATLENFIHMPGQFSLFPSLSPTDGYTFTDMQYTFTPNLPVLLQKNLVNLGCEPAVMLSRAFVNNVVFANAASQLADLSAITLPDPVGAQQCLLAAISTLRTNMTVAGVADFQAMANLCLSKLQNDTKNALSGVIGAGFSPCNSSFTLTPSTQFTTLSITVTVDLNENNGISITSGLPSDVAANLATQITAYPTFGKVSNFTYDGYQSFTAQLTSTEPGGGSIMIAFQNQTLCTDTIPTDGSAPSHTLQQQNYQFIFAGNNLPPTGEGDTIGVPRRDAGDLSRDSSGSGGD